MVQVCFADFCEIPVNQVMFKEEVNIFASNIVDENGEKFIDLRVQVKKDLIEQFSKKGKNKLPFIVFNTFANLPDGESAKQTLFFVEKYKPFDSIEGYEYFYVKIPEKKFPKNIADFFFEMFSESDFV